jgi:hypothetical protein
VARSRSEPPRGSARNDAASVPLDEACGVLSSVMFVLLFFCFFVLFFGSFSCGGVNVMHVAPRSMRAPKTHRSATRPVSWLMPSQVPSARRSRPESTLPLDLLLMSFPFPLARPTPTPPSLLEEAAGADVDVDNASNEWKCAGRVGRARYSSRVAHRMLSHASVVSGNINAVPGDKEGRGRTERIPGV